MSSVQVGRLVDAAKALAAAPVGDLPDAQVAEELLALRKLADVAEAAYLSRLATFDTRGLAQTRDGLSTRAWLRHKVHIAPGETSRAVKTAKALTSLPVVAAALADGEIRLPHATAIVDAASLLGADVIAGCQDALVDAARTDDPSTLRAALRGLGAATENKRAVREAERRDEGRWLDVATTFDGALHLQGVLGAEDGAIVKAAIDALASPTGRDDTRTPAQRRADALTETCRRQLDTGALPSTGGETAHLLVITHHPTLHPPNTDGDSHGKPGGRADRPSSTTPGRHDYNHRSPDRRSQRHHGRPAEDTDVPDGDAHPRGPAERASPTPDRPPDPAGADPGRYAPISGGYGELPDGTILGGESVRRLACNAKITPITTAGPDFMPLNVGRTRRTATPAQRKALRIRDLGCRFPGCDRPPEWCEAHHVIFWTNGGRTDIDEMILLCRKHHTTVHEGHWQIRMPTPGHFVFTNPRGQAIFTPPNNTTRHLVARLINLTGTRERDHIGTAPG